MGVRFPSMVAHSLPLLTGAAESEVEEQVPPETLGPRDQP